jgi:CheY-like chemotaxis protein
MKILIADDDPTIRSELGELLMQQGHVVSAASDGGEAIRLLEAEAFDAALLDLVMPRATGIEVLRRVRVARPQTAVIMITGQGTIDTAVEAMKAGAVDFVAKPFEVESIQRTLQTIAEERAARKLLSGSAADPAAVKGVIDDAARRKALLAILGPAAKAPVRGTRVLRIAEDASPPDVFAPSQLYRLNSAVEDHIARTDRPAVFLSGLSLLEATHGRGDVAAWIRQLGDRCGSRGGTVVVGSGESALASDLDGASRDLGTVDQRLQGMLESLANPVRRAIVDYVASSGPVAYSAILKRNFVDSSSKLSFHLGKLQADGLLVKVPSGAYTLTEDGRRAWRVLRALGEEGHRRPIILFDRA